MSDIVRKGPTGGGSPLTCSGCGREGQVPGAPCEACGRTQAALPLWAQQGRNQRLVTRRRWLLAGAIVFLLALVTWVNYPFFPNPKILLFNRPATDLSSVSSPGQWSMNGRDTAQSRYATFSSIQPVGRVRWSRNLGRPTLSAPVASDGVVYVGGYFRVLALDGESGRILWEKRTEGPVHSSPAVAGDNLYVGLLERRLAALGIASGETRWEFETGGQITASPAVDSGMVYVGSWDGVVHAVDAATGDRIWRYNTGGAVRYQPVLHDGLLVAANSKRELRVLNSRTGQDRFVFRLPESAAAAPALANGMAYFPSAGGIYAMDATAREAPGLYQLKKVWALFHLWQIPGIPRPPVQRGSLWRFAPQGATSSIVTAPAVAGEVFYTGDLQGNFYAREALGGTGLWQFRAEGGIAAPPAIAGPRVYFGTRDGFLYALDRSDGTLIWRLPLGAPIETAPAIAGGRLYVRTGDGQLHAIE